jgi:hydrogenase assembly chaperone HypC/HupF
MCLTIPKKVVSLDNGVVVLLPNGARQEVKTIVELAVGDFVLTHQNTVIEKMDPEEAVEVLKMLNLSTREEGI